MAGGRLNMIISEKRLKQLDALAAEDMRTRSSYITSILQKFLNKMEKRKLKKKGK